MIRVSTQMRTGLTLTELLVVISIIVLLAGVMVPMMQPFFAGQDLREAARSLNGFLSAAQAKAIRLGRPVGVWMQKDPKQWGLCYQCFQAESPPAYSGDTEFARAMLFRLNPPPPTQPDFQLRYNPYNDLAWYEARVPLADAVIGTQLLQHLMPSSPLISEYWGDEIRFNQRGPRLRLFRVVQDNAQLLLRFYFLAHSSDLPPLSDPVPLPVAFEVFRRPEITSHPPLILPVGATIDFSGYGSGWGPSAAFSRGLQPVVVMFSPQVGVERVYGAADPISNDSPMFMITPSKTALESERLAQEAAQENPGPERERKELERMEFVTRSLADPSSFWVSVNRRTSRINTAVSAGVPDTLTLSSITDPQLRATAALQQTRTIALEQISTGGR